MPDKPYENFIFNKALDESGYPIQGAKPFDLRYDIMNYGRVDQSQNAVMLRSKSLDHLGLEKVFTIKELEGTQAHFALNFVADAFNDLKRHFAKANSMGRLKKSGSQELIKLEPKEAYQEPQKAYDSYITIVFDIFKNIFLSRARRNKKVLNFNDFMIMFKSFHDEFGQEMVVTKTGFIKSPLFNPLSSGLMIHLDELNPSDSTDATKWITDPNFDFYRNSAIKFGFIVDKYMPWRLIADVSSKQMQDYWVKYIYPTQAEIQEGRRQKKSDSEIMEIYLNVISKYGLLHNPGGPSNLFDSYYERTYLTDAIELRRKFFDMYIQFIEEEPSVMKFDNISCKNARLSKSFLQREKITYSQLKKSYQMDYWMELCFRMRLKEESLKIESKEYDKYVLNGKKIMKTLDKIRAMEYINNVVKMLKSKNLDLRFCQDYEKCVDTSLPLQMAPPKGLTNLMGMILAGLAPPPNIDSAVLAIQTQIKDFEEMNKNLEQTTAVGIVEQWAEMHGFDD